MQVKYRAFIRRKRAPLIEAWVREERDATQCRLDGFGGRTAVNLRRACGGRWVRIHGIPYSIGASPSRTVCVWQDSVLRGDAGAIGQT